MIICIDFDETITEYRPFPFTAPYRKDFKKVLKKLYNEGHKLILWTARLEPYYSEVINRLKDDDLYKYFWWDYKNSPCGKVYADLYIDNRNIDCEEINWKEIYKKIQDKIKVEK